MEPISYPYPPDPGDRAALDPGELTPGYAGLSPTRQYARFFRALRGALDGFVVSDDYAAVWVQSPVNDRETDPFILISESDDTPDGYRIGVYTVNAETGDLVRVDGPDPGNCSGAEYPGAGYDPAGVPALARIVRGLADRFGIVSAYAAVAG